MSLDELTGAQRQVLELGATNIICVSIKPPQETQPQAGGAMMLRFGLKRTDYKLLSSTIPTVTKAIPIRETNKEVRYLLCCSHHCLYLVEYTQTEHQHLHVAHRSKLHLHTRASS